MTPGQEHPLETVDPHYVAAATRDSITCTCGEVFTRGQHNRAIVDDHRHAYGDHELQERRGGPYDLAGDAWATCPLGCGAPRLFKRMYACVTMVLGEPPTQMIIDRGRTCDGPKQSTREQREAVGSHG